MKKLKLIYNPFSGDKSFIEFLDDCVKILQSGGYEVHLFRSMEIGDIQQHINDMPKEFYDAVIVSGGDGTINTVINAMLKNQHDIPLGIIPCGTANDFATSFGIPNDIEAASKIIVENNLKSVDIGMVGKDYFVNVCGAGFLTNISQNMGMDETKSFLGKFAYYIKGISQIANLTPLNVRITNSTESFTDDIYLFIVLNSRGAGGFENLSPDSLINDGLFEFIAFRSMPILEMAKLMIKAFSGEFLKDPNIIYFQDNYIKVEPLSVDEQYLETDIDGEPGPHLPVEIVNIKEKLRIFSRKDN